MINISAFQAVNEGLNFLIVSIKTERSQLVLAYIYKIYNDINNKIYIGKTLTSLQERFKKHLYDSRRDCFKKDLYIEQ